MSVQVTVVYNTAHSSSDNLPSNPPHNHHQTDINCREGRMVSWNISGFINIYISLRFLSFLTYTFNDINKR